MRRKLIRQNNNKTECLEKKCNERIKTNQKRKSSPFFQVLPLLYPKYGCLGLSLLNKVVVCNFVVIFFIENQRLIKER